eukprot:m.208398 g.208398  ORF g.208398 m.208398 type:complete len:84 (-) comp18533_c0_seq1:359-610(-)
MSSFLALFHSLLFSDFNLFAGCFQPPRPVLPLVQLHRSVQWLVYFHLLPLFFAVVVVAAYLKPAKLLTPTFKHAVAQRTVAAL